MRSRLRLDRAMSENPASRIIDCMCGLRYMRSAISTLAPESGHVRCACGSIVGSWNGSYRLHFEPEDVAFQPQSSAD